MTTQQKQQTFTKLSQAMRYGATLRPQAQWDFFVESDNMYEEIQSCALGAVWEAITGRTETHNEGDDVIGFLATFFDLGNEDKPFRTEIPCPPEGRKKPIFWAITHMNDSLLYTREEIADYLEKLGY